MDNPSPKQWDAHICMEEPFDRTNAGRAVVKRPQFEMILKSFRQADNDVNKNGAADLQTVVNGGGSTNNQKKVPEVITLWFEKAKKYHQVSTYN